MTSSPAITTTCTSSTAIVIPPSISPRHFVATGPIPTSPLSVSTWSTTWLMTSLTISSIHCRLRPRWWLRCTWRDCLWPGFLKTSNGSQESNISKWTMFLSGPFERDPWRFSPDWKCFISSTVKLKRSRLALSKVSNNFKTNEFGTNNLIQLTYSISFVELENSESGLSGLHLIGDFSETSIRFNGNLLTQFEENVFKTILESKFNSNSSSEVIVLNSKWFSNKLIHFLMLQVHIYISNLDPIACDCNLAWLLRDNRHLIPNVLGSCIYETETIQFKDFDPYALQNCQ